jgi:acyl-CoA-binding protein
MYNLIKSKTVTMTELKETYTLDEALKLYALIRMGADIEYQKAKNLKNKKRR